MILGAGISGISAAYHLKLHGNESIIYEKDSDWGGLCGNFNINRFNFDNAIHLSFTENKYVKKIFSKSCKFIFHKPLAYNYYKGHWLKHPAQNNLYKLNSTEKIKIIKDFVNNKNKNIYIKNYEEWLKANYGNYFSNNFSIPYTKKYWTKEAKDLSINWIANRIYRPNIEELLTGAFEVDTPNTYYAKEMRYPNIGGYKSFLKNIAQECNIQTNKKAIEIDVHSQKIVFNDGSFAKYTNLISSIPLPEYSKLIKNLPSSIKQTLNKLEYTSVALISIGLNKPNIPKYLWFYIYDEDILASRCYSPSIKSFSNAPNNCSSLQFEIYFSKNKPLIYDKNDLIEHIINKSEKMGIFRKKDIIVQDYRILEYGNVIYYHGMEKDRKTILNYLNKINIKTIGRFGEWKYLWSDQALLSGKAAAERVF